MRSSARRQNRKRRCHAAAQRGVYAIGVDTDQYFTLPEAAVAHALQRHEARDSTCRRPHQDGKRWQLPEQMVSISAHLAMLPITIWPAKFRPKLIRRCRRSLTGILDGSITDQRSSGETLSNLLLIHNKRGKGSSPFPLIFVARYSF